MKFTKMEGCGNDYVYVNGFTETVEDKPAMARKVSDRHFGIGSDGLIFINPSKVADCEMEMYNSDGSRSEMCGNGIRCVSKFAYDNGIVNKTSLSVETLAGIKYIDLKMSQGEVVGAKVNMGKPILVPSEIPCDVTNLAGPVDGYVLEKPMVVDGITYSVSAVSMGNPHVIIRTDSDLSDFPIEKLGPLFEVHPAFPRKVNTEFINIIDRKTIRMRVWERGAGETFACGTGACAVAVSAILNGYVDNEVTIKLLGGDLKISFSGDVNDPVYMEGPAVTVFKGEI